MQIRLASSADATLLPSIERSSGEKFRTLPELAWVADDAVMTEEAHQPHIERGMVWVAEDETGDLKGFVTTEAFEDALHVWQLAVRLDFQGQGIGRRLMMAAVEAAHRWELPAVTLTTFRDVAWNEPFYGRLRFKTVDRDDLDARLAELLDREDRLGLPMERRCAMRLDLSSAI